MNIKKQISIIFSVVLFASTLIMGACSDDDNNYEVSEEWKKYQESVFQKVKSEVDKETGALIFPKSYSSESRNGDIYVKSSDFITNNQLGKFDPKQPIVFPSDEEENETESAVYKATKSGQRTEVYESDTVLLRYEGWFYKENGSKVIFESTERNISTGKWTNNNLSVTARVNGDILNTQNIKYTGNVDGLKTALLNMKVKDEIIVCIPYQLGYETYGGTYSNSQVVPGYTTLFFNIKLLRNITAEKELENSNI